MEANCDILQKQIKRQTQRQIQRQNNHKYKENYKDKYQPKYEEDEGEAKTEHPNELLLSPAETEKMTMTQVESYKFCKA